MTTRSHPYTNLPNHAFWSRAVAKTPRALVDPAIGFDLRINTETRVATAGSCFAQHIARHLRNNGLNYFVAEAGHPMLSESTRARFQYGVFSARYGNVYTTRQLVQLVSRAYGEFEPIEDVWLDSELGVLDPFRPTVQPGGFASPEEMRADRKQHLAAVRTMFEMLDVFVFTLGLTECWQSQLDGAVFPVCPGVSGGSFDSLRYSFLNQTVSDVTADLQYFLARLSEINPNAQVILTVSPVPLVATAQSDVHVMSATTYSKSVLRVAADDVSRVHDHVHYFPSFEIITGAYTRGAYFAPDLRSVTEEGVEHVMGAFLRHTAGLEMRANDGAQATPTPSGNHLTEVERLIEVECDEVALDRR